MGFCSKEELIYGCCLSLVSRLVFLLKSFVPYRQLFIVTNPPKKEIVIPLFLKKRLTLQLLYQVNCFHIDMLDIFMDSKFQFILKTGS